MEQKVFGHFSFKLKNNGHNIEGVYLNKHTPDIQTEKGTKYSGPVNSFEGIWDTDWHDTDLKTAKLTITAIGNLFSLGWQLTNALESYTGMGYKNSNDELCGYYERN